jgi:hypothetical protein
MFFQFGFQSMGWNSNFRLKVNTFSFRFMNVWMLSPKKKQHHWTFMHALFLNLFHLFKLYLLWFLFHRLISMPPSSWTTLPGSLSRSWTGQTFQGSLSESKNIGLLLTLNKFLKRNRHLMVLEFLRWTQEFTPRIAYKKKNRLNLHYVTAALSVIWQWRRVIQCTAVQF